MMQSSLKSSSVIVIDNGSGEIKAGFGMKSYPEAVFPSVLGRYHDTTSDDKTFHDNKTYIGLEALEKRNLLSLSHPIERGIVMNWSEMEQIWNHTFFNELQVDPADFIVLMTEPPLNPKANRERTTKIMFETFKVQGFYCSLQANLALFDSGRLTGLLVDSGESSTYLVSIYEGYLLPHTIASLDVAGRDASDFLMKMLIEAGHELTTFENRQIVDTIKHNVCFVSLDFTKDLEDESKDCEIQHELSNGSIITIGKERFKCPEIYFNPSLVGLMDEVPLQELIYSRIMKCDPDIKNDLFGNIVLAGGSTLFRGFSDRIVQEVQRLAPNQTIVKVLAPKERAISAWKGASILTGLSTFEHMWITRDEYDEDGPSVIHRRCFN